MIVANPLNAQKLIIRGRRWFHVSPLP